MKEGWVIKTLGEVGKVSMCKRILKKQTNSTSGIPFYKIGTFGKEANAFIPEDIYTEFISKYSFPKKGDILLSASGTIGRRVIYDGKPAYFQDSNIVWIDNDEKEVLNEYLYKFYGYCDWNPSKGATISRLYNDDLRRIKIPIPPLIEQKLIVAVLDKAFAAIDQAKTNIEKNIKNAQELFQSKLNDIFSQKGEGWEEMTLGEICEIKPPKKLAKEKLNETELVSFIPMKYLGVNQMHFNSTETKELKNAYSGYVYFEDGDVLLAKITPCFENGKLGIAKGLINGIGFGSSEYIVYRPGNKLLSEYLYFYLNRDAFRKKGTALMSGAVGHKRIQPNFYENELISLPKIEEQKLVCGKVMKLQGMLSETQQNYETKISSLEELKKSILQKAFAGELTR